MSRNDLMKYRLFFLSFSNDRNIVTDEDPLRRNVCFVVPAFRRRDSFNQVRFLSEYRRCICRVIGLRNLSKTFVSSVPLLCPRFPPHQKGIRKPAKQRQISTVRWSSRERIHLQKLFIGRYCHPQ